MRKFRKSPVCRAVATFIAASMSLATASPPALASSHMDAPLITLDDPANTTDVYAFRSQSEDGTIQYLTTALAVYPFEDPGIGPNSFRFDDNVRYEIHLALGEDVAEGRATLSYQFDFKTQFKNPATTLQTFLGIVDCTDLEGGFPRKQNLRQTYTVTKVDRRSQGKQRATVLGTGKVPPNNQGLLTPQYNNAASGGLPGEGPAKGGVATTSNLDPCTQFGITDLADGYQSFGGQRDDGFYADIQSVFDLDFTFGKDPLLAGAGKPFDSQGGFNVHTMVLNIPLKELGSSPVAGVYATTSRRRVTVLSKDIERRADRMAGKFIQVGRQGNPLFNEALVHVSAKDIYARTDPTKDRDLFKSFAESPLAELGVTLNNVSGIFIPDVIKVDLTTPPARMAGPPDDSGYSRLGAFGSDVLTNAKGGTVSGGWPNGYRFGDDVLDIAFIALGLGIFDGVDSNDMSYNKVFPYAATPQNGRVHGHH